MYISNLVGILFSTIIYILNIMTLYLSLLHIMDGIVTMTLWWYESFFRGNFGTVCSRWTWSVLDDIINGPIIGSVPDAEGINVEICDMWTSWMSGCMDYGNSEPTRPLENLLPDITTKFKYGNHHFNLIVNVISPFCEHYWFIILSFKRGLRTFICFWIKSFQLIIKNYKISWLWYFFINTYLLSNWCHLIQWHQLNYNKSFN